MSDSPLKLHIFAPDWRKLSLQKVSEFIKDGTHGTHMRVSSGIPLLSAKNISPFGEILITDDDSLISAHEYEKIHSKYELEKNDLLLTVVGTLGRRALVTGSKKFAIQRSIGVIRCKKKIILPEFIYQFTGTDYFQDQLILRSNATAQAGVYLGELAKIEAPCPPLPEQQKIAAILSSVDGVIEKTRSQIDKLKDLKTGMMQELLTKGIGSGGVPHTEFKDSPVGRIPAGWECMKLEDVSERIWIGLVTTMTKHYVEQGVLLVRNSDIKEFSFRYKGMINLAPQFAGDNHSRGFEIGDIATVHTGDVGTSAVIDQRLQGAQGFATINTRVNLSLATPEFVAEMLNSPILGGQIKKVVTGDGRDNLNLKDFVKLLIPIPNTLDEQRRIHWAIDSIRMKLTGLSEKLEVMTNTKKALMQDLLTGKVRVKVDQKESAVA